MRAHAAGVGVRIDLVSDLHEAGGKVTFADGQLGAVVKKQGRARAIYRNFREYWHVHVTSRYILWKMWRDCKRIS